MTATVTRHGPGAAMRGGLVVAGALAYAVAVAFVLPRSGALITTYARASDAAAALDLAAGLSLIAGGIVLRRERTGGPIGVLAIAAGVVWFAPDWVGWEDGPPLMRSLGALVAPLLPALVLHIALAAPRGRLGSRAAEAVVGSAYACAVVAGVGWALVRNPFEDPYCWSNCTDNVFLVHADRGLTEALDSLWLGAALAMGAIAAAGSLWRLARATGTARRTLWPALAPAVLAGAAGAAYAIARLRIPAEDPERGAYAAIFVARAVSAIALGAGLIWMAGAARRTRAAVARVVAEREARAAAVPLREALASALGDPSLEVAYPLPGADGVVDAAGEPLALPAAGSGRVVTTISRSGEPVALVAHNAALLDSRALEDEIGAAARLAVDNERLQAVVLAQVRALRASRARIVETGDAARRRLERDLHDGAQQRLLALSYELRLAEASARSEGDAALASALAGASGEAQAALDELRDLANGIYPAILAEAGLHAALETLADTAPLPVDVGAVTRERLPAAAETAAYLVAAACVVDAAQRRADHAAVAAAREGDLLHVRVTGAASASQHLVDRIGALGGRLETSAATVEAEIPCA